MGESVAVNPRVFKNLLHGVPFGGFVLEHTCKKVFQLDTQIGSFFEYLPVDVRSVSADQTIIFILANCFFERLTLSNHGKEHNSGSEHVSTLTSVRVENVLLWGHVTEGTHVVMEHIRSVFSTKVCGETEVSNFEIEVFVNQNIFWFDISMTDFGLVVHVVEGIKELNEEVSGNVFTKLAG